MHTGEGTPGTHVNPLLQVDIFSDSCLHGIPYDPGAGFFPGVGPDGDGPGPDGVGLTGPGMMPTGTHFPA